MQKLSYIDYASATAIALVMLVISFLLLFAINVIQMKQAKRPIIYNHTMLKWRMIKTGWEKL